jgi:amidophosphoribosyltransferase
VPKFIDAMTRLEGAYSLVGAVGEKDDRRARSAGHPAAGARRSRRRVDILASETCALDIIGARFVRDVEPGEVVVITGKGIESHFPFEKQTPRLCIFEYVYFARPDSYHRGPQCL